MCREKLGLIITELDYACVPQAGQDAGSTQGSDGVAGEWQGNRRGEASCTLGVALTSSFGCSGCVQTLARSRNALQLVRVSTAS